MALQGFVTTDPVGIHKANSTFKVHFKHTKMVTGFSEAVSPFASSQMGAESTQIQHINFIYYIEPQTKPHTYRTYTFHILYIGPQTGPQT